MDNICCCCGSPGITLMPSGKWLCKTCSPFAATESDPPYNEYLKNKGIELCRLYESILLVVNALQTLNEESGYCKICGGEEKHKDGCLMLRLLGLTDLSKVEYHPYLFFREFITENQNNEYLFLQDRQVYGQPSIYLENQYNKIPTTKATTPRLLTFDELMK